MRYYIADCHFFHSGMIERMDRRPFPSVEEMNEYMTEKWNKKVRKNDEIVILGDLSVARAADTNALVKRLNGKKTLIIGNHDRYLKEKGFDTSAFVKITPYLELNDNKRKVVLCHYPIMCYNGQNHLGKDGRPDGYMLYGHVHDTLDEALVDGFISEEKEHTREIKDRVMNIPCNMINCFCGFSDYTPLTLDEWIENDRERRKKNVEKEKK